MNSFHGYSQKQAFFEGWYLKHQNDNQTLAIIVAFHIDDQGEKSASIQVITDDGAIFLPYSVADFGADKDRFEVKVVNNVFSEKGINLDISSDNTVIKGLLTYGQFVRPKSDMMGPFRFFSNMQCNHGVLSFTHQLHGQINVNGEIFDFDNGTGYIEKDWGRSFPKSYIWTQSNWEDDYNNSIMISVADIPFLGSNFIGCICALWYHGKEYRLATYKGAKIKKYSKDEVIITQGKYRLDAKLIEQKSFGLQAPNMGSMTRVINESPSCKVQYRFLINNQLIFNLLSDQASFESVKENIDDK